MRCLLNEECAFEERFPISSAVRRAPWRACMGLFWGDAELEVLQHGVVVSPQNQTGDDVKEKPLCSAQPGHCAHVLLLGLTAC